MRARLRLVAALAVAVALGCAAHGGGAVRYRSYLDTEAGQFVFEFTGKDRQTREKVEAAIRNATPRLSQWGGLNQPVTVHILPSHTALEEAVNRYGYDWLRAWARYDEIFLQSPRTWSVFGAAQSDVNELVLHELTHSVMYQQVADRTHWARKGIPLWFREGMASWTARQGYRWPSLEDLARFYDQRPDQDPVADPDPLYQRESALVYAGAHHAFSFLVKRYGVERIRDVLAAMREDRTFDDAFTATLHVTPQAFVDDFRRFVRLRGFKGIRHRALQPLPPRTLPPAPTPHAEPPPGVEGEGEGGTADDPAM